MQISISHAKAQLTDLVRRAEEGEEVALTRHGHVAAHIVSAPSRSTLSPEEKAARIDAIVASAQKRLKAFKGEAPSAARSQDFLYNDDGMPE